MKKVVLIKGDDRYKNIKEALSILKEDLKEKIKRKKKILIKPNLVSARVALSSTHVDALRAVLDFLSSLTSQKIIVAEGTAEGETFEAFENYGFLKLKEKYNIEFVDLNKDKYEEFELFDEKFSPLKFKIAKTVLESDYRISLALPKTHDSVVVTLSLKNIAVGSLKDKGLIHQGWSGINLNLARLAEIIPPHLSIIDGFWGMEGNGPVYGEKVEMKIALAGEDFLSVDAVAASLMGFSINDIGYLYLLFKKRDWEEKDITKKVEILGNVALEECKRNFKPHQNLAVQLKWKEDKEKLLSLFLKI